MSPKRHEIALFVKRSELLWKFVGYAEAVSSEAHRVHASAVAACTHDRVLMAGFSAMQRVGAAGPQLHHCIIYRTAASAFSHTTVEHMQNCCAFLQLLPPSAAPFLISLHLLFER